MLVLLIYVKWIQKVLNKLKFVDEPQKKHLKKQKNIINIKKKDTTPFSI